MKLTLIRRFGRNSRGNISITTALAGTLLLTAVGTSMDGGRLITTKMQLQSITDAAALMAAMPESISDQSRQALALESIRSHVERRGDLVIGGQDVFVRNRGSEVEVELEAEVPLLFGAFLGGSKRSVRVSSTAQETESGGLNAVSISVILDLSDSMAEDFERATRLEAVQSAVSDTFRNITTQFGGEAAAQTSVSTGLYPFNWGLVDESLVPVQAGTSLTTQELKFATLDEGSVPPEAFEQAVADQLAATRTEGQRERYIVFLTDGGVDNERDDDVGRFLSERAIYDTANSTACRAALDDVEDTQEQLNDTLDWMYQYSRTLRPYGQQHRARYSRSEADTEAHGRAAVDIIMGNGCLQNCQRIGRELTAFLDAKSQRDLTCEPRQTQRVVEACEEARDNDIRMIALDLSGESWAAADLVDLCVNPATVADRVAQNRENRTGRPDPLGRTLSQPTQTFPSGLQVQLSVDGRSMSATVTTEVELREVLATMLPEATQAGERTVRLVN